MEKQYKGIYYLSKDNNYTLLLNSQKGDYYTVIEAIKVSPLAYRQVYKGEFIFDGSNWRNLRDENYLKKT